MQCTPTLKQFRERMGISQTQVAAEMGIRKPSYCTIETDMTRVPRPETVTRIVEAFNRILIARGSERRVSYDEMWETICVGRNLGAPPSPKPDLSAGLSALGDLPTVDHSTAAPTAQGA